MEAPRIRRRYDHRFRDMVRETGDVELAVRNGVPRSTARDWSRLASPKVITLDVASMSQDRVQSKVATESEQEENLVPRPIRRPRSRSREPCPSRRHGNDRIQIFGPCGQLPLPCRPNFRIAGRLAVRCTPAAEVEAEDGVGKLQLAVSVSIGTPQAHRSAWESPPREGSFHIEETAKVGPTCRGTPSSGSRAGR
jgi:hypothetical protein